MLKQIREMKFSAVVCLLEILLVAALGVFGCATTENVQPSSDQAGATSAETMSVENKQITGIRIEETTDATVVYIESNHVLDYTLAEPPLQQSKVLYFPDSALDLTDSDYPVENEIIGTIQAVELVRGGPSKIVIPVKTPGVTCEANRGDNDHILQVVFPGSPSAEFARTEPLSEDMIEEETVEPADDYYQPEDEDYYLPEEDDDYYQPEEEDDYYQPEEDTYYQPEEEADVVRDDMPAVAATRFENIGVQEEADQVKVKIKADGTITAYKSFTLKGPPRIVLDLTGLTTPFKKEQRLTVNSDIVQQVRHCGHPGYLRVVLDVNQDYLSDFKAVSVNNGLVVYVGNTADLAQEAAVPEDNSWAQAETTEEDYYAPQAETEEDYYAPQAEEDYYAPQEETEPVVDREDYYAPPPEPSEESYVAMEENDDYVGQYDRPALVNRVDFIDDQGRSTISIGTTHPVKFNVKAAEKRVRLILESADILSFRQRPLITTRFESAIDSIIPMQTADMKDQGISVIDINLREDVAYSTERQDNEILVHFEPSTVAPDPAREVVIPTDSAFMESEDMMAEPTGDVEAETDMPDETDVLTGSEDWDEEGVDGSADRAEDVVSEVEPMPGDTKKRYTGEPIALEFYKTDIRNVIRILKDVSGMNFAIDEGVSGSVTLSFVNPVPWDQVLDLVLDMNDLGMKEQGGIVRISTQETLLKQKEAARAALAADQELKITEELLAPLVTEYFSISYSDAKKEILPHIESILTEDRGHAKVDTRTKQLIMTDIPEKIEMAREIIERIDKVTPQVMINARIVETSTNFSREFGTTWAMNNNPGTYRSELGGTYDYNVAMNNPASSATNIMGVSFSRIVGTPFSLDAILSLMESVGEVRIISSPRVITLDSKKATISQGQEIPYNTVEDFNVTTEFKDAELKLEVTPYVTPDNRVRMEIHIEEKEVGDQGALDEPPLNTKEALTELLVNDGDTIVIGGIIQETERESESGIPLLSKIPLLGNLFKFQARSNEKSELLIFITPTIVRLD